MYVLTYGIDALVYSYVCTYFMQHKKFPPGLQKQILLAIQEIELYMGIKFGHDTNPLLLSVRSGARQSMPGMMETVLNIGMNAQTIEALIQKTNNPKFVYDSFRRLLMMYADVVMEKSNHTINI